MGVVELLLAGRADTARFDEAVDAADASDVAGTLTLAAHPDPGVRRVVAGTLPLLTHGDPPTEQMVAVIIGLTLDADRGVRDYACFVLAEQWREVDTPALREALAARLDDIDRGTRSEALVGLAYRRDPRALARVRDALSRPRGDVWRLEMVAAGALSDPQLHDLVQRHQDGWATTEDTQTADAVRRLTDPTGPGPDLLDGMAKLCRSRARGWPDGDALGAWDLVAEMLEIAPYRAREFFDGVLARVAGDDAAEQELREHSALAHLTGDNGSPRA
ncbi:hypothetical protein J4G33_15380 [Actinotalea sp. BY-33]|uniref:HEAT repeat domain-containing protein n=1 Tax=Actinotalea soli TaxID=2819234 RepID=A0A939RX11_9CELL|nr:hypothetical protein [Actinotalea soli]MBO1753188.1 hypothetical protein [Actinotalea soli]